MCDEAMQKMIFLSDPSSRYDAVRDAMATAGPIGLFWKSKYSDFKRKHF
jgi:hypothetical protein